MVPTRCVFPRTAACSSAAERLRSAWVAVQSSTPPRRQDARLLLQEATARSGRSLAGALGGVHERRHSPKTEVSIGKSQAAGAGRWRKSRPAAGSGVGSSHARRITFLQARLSGASQLASASLAQARAAHVAPLPDPRRAQGSRAAPPSIHRSSPSARLGRPRR